MAPSSAGSVSSERARDRLSAGVTTVVERATLSVRTPVTGERFGTVPACESADVAAAVDRALARDPDVRRAVHLLKLILCQ